MVDAIANAEAGSSVRTKLNTLIDGYNGAWANVKTAFGAVGNGSVDDTAELQAALDSGNPLYFPPGNYLITAPLTYDQTVVMYGSLVKNTTGTPFARITGNFNAPLIRRAESVLNDDDTFTGTLFPGSGLGFTASHLEFLNSHVQGCCIQIYQVTAPICFTNCGFSFKRRGLMLLTAFDTLIVNCTFTGTWFTDHGIDPAEYVGSIGLLMPGHSTCIGSSFQGCGTGIFAYGPASNIIGCRLEVNGYGIRVGGTNMTPGSLGQAAPISRAMISGVSLEANLRGVLVQNAGGLTLQNLGIQGSTNTPGTGTKSEYGIEIASGAAGVELRNCGGGGLFTRAPIVLTGGKPLLTALSGTNSEPRPASIAGSASMFCQSGTYGVAYHVERMPFNPGINGALAADLTTVTAFSDLQLRGLKGLNAMDPNVLPSKLGGIESVATSATTHAVAWQSGKSSGHGTFSGEPAVGTDAGSTLAAGTYYYAHTIIHASGETGLTQTSAGAGNANYKTATVTSGQNVTLSMVAVNITGYRHRLYRGPATLGVFEGFWELPATQGTFIDNGTTAFTGRDNPPGVGLTIPSMQEPDANYGVIAVPSWNTTTWITAKATTGFTINFGTAAPASATVQWLLFRP